jgi:membrane protein DedA with SNARE-associated domain
MSIPAFQSMDNLLQQYGYAAAFVGVSLESTGIPLPGESLFATAADGSSEVATLAGGIHAGIR